MSFTVRQLDEGEEDVRWNAYVDENPRATVYHRLEWRSLIRSLFGHREYYFIAENAERQLVGILPIIRQKSLLFGDNAVSVPYFNYGGALGENGQVEDLLMQHASRVLGEAGVHSIEFRDAAPRSEQWPVKTEKVAMVLDLPESMEALGKAIGAKRRSQARRAARENPEVKIGGVELLGGFYAVFAENMRDLGTPVYPQKFFQAILDHFPEHCSVVVVELGGKPVSSAFLLRWRDCMEIPWASTLREVNGISMNMYMYWHVLEYAIQSGCKTFDFGRSSVDAGTYKFKKQWGAEPQQLYWHYWLPDGAELPQLNPNNPKYRLMISAWQKLPLAIANALGPHIVKNLP